MSLYFSVGDCIVVFVYCTEAKSAMHCFAFMNDVFAVSPTFQFSIFTFGHSVILSALLRRSFVRLFVPSFLRSFVPSFLRLFLRSFVPSFLRSFVPSFLRSFFFLPVAAVYLSLFLLIIVFV